MPRRPFRQAFIATGLALATACASAQTATESELARRLDQLATELASVKAQLAQLQKERAQEAQARSANAPATAAANAVPATSAAAVAPAPAATTAAAAAAAAAEPALPRREEPATVISSYGEINYNRPTHAGENARADVRRFVLGYQHRFDSRTKVVTELEVEHAVSSADDPGEVEVEQAYVERQLTPVWAARAGLFLIPAGLLNENHEPTAYHGVERNFVETAIIPSTWREGGVQLVGSFDNGLTLQGGISTGFDLTKWDATAGEGRESPLGAIHQELSLAKAHDLAVFGAANWRGIPGVLVGASIFSGNATQARSGATSRITLWDLHTRWTPGRWDLAALYARGTISNTAALNLPLVGNPTLIPKSFDGWYVQGAYKVWSSEDYALSPFVRWEQFNTARSFADLGPGLTPAGAATERVVTLGANVMLSPQVVLKADYQRFRENRDMNRFNLGVGWAF